MSKNAPTRIASGELFPTDEPLAADQLIGREEDVSAVASALQGGTNLVIAEPRRTGKTTVCDAALGRLRDAGLYTVQLDLWAITDVVELAEALVAKTVANRPLVRRLVHDVRRKGRDAATQVQLRSIVTLSGELGDDVEIAFEPGLASRDPQRYIDYALRLPQKIAAADGKRVAVFFDEFQNVRDLEASSGDNDPEGLQKRMRSIFQRSAGVSFLFAGSLDHIMRDIFGPNQRAFSQFGGFHELQAIEADDWKNGLTERLSRDGCTIEDAALDHLVELGELHPRATMLIAQQAHLTSVQDDVRVIDMFRVGIGYEFALRLDRAKHQTLVDRIRSVSSGKAARKHALRLARRVARGETTYTGLSPETARRILRALNDAGIIEPRDQGQGWKIVDPLFRRYLAEMDPTAV